MTNAASGYVIWVTRNDAGAVEDVELPNRASLEGSAIEVRTKDSLRLDSPVFTGGSRERG